VPRTVLTGSGPRPGRRRRPSPQRSSHGPYSLDQYLADMAAMGWHGGTGFTQTLADGRKVSWPSTNIPATTGRLQSNGASWTVSHFVARNFGAGRFVFRRISPGGRPGEFFTSSALTPLQSATPGLSQSQILVRAYLDACAGGNSYWTTPRKLGLEDSDRAVRLPLGQVQIVVVPGPGGFGWEKAGYVYSPDPKDPGLVHFLDLDQVAHFMPWPDPADPYRGMSWMTPHLRQVYTDELLTDHVANYFLNAATPNLIVRYPVEVDSDEIAAYKKVYEAVNSGPANAGRAVHVGGGVDITPAGANLADAGASLISQMSQAALAAAAGVPAILVGFAGASASEPEYVAQGQARRLFADATLWPLWNDAAAAFSTLIAPPPGGPAELAIDGRDVPMLREDSKDQAEVLAVLIGALNAAVMNGWDPETAKAAVLAGDLSLLTHTGALSVQLYPGGNKASTDVNGESNG
jgi:hypothetical protein